ncbi:HlyD family secretion protein [Rhodospirillum rubrum]|uniref:Secretion protein HlyD n=1 Tax=Rhodospirillum rubrum (strain ATCC 11170 / ATH 1.1.1 / DSM 467 / LMG 4362 / NCIMB 8255 / S1) TaxID=269796 RepID=Q2RY94_RHORT|nr:HlyD family efflux transporter periplasmic adaptor subunit [Rhodospirillum rubrum]ABC20901.1 Secretion protein HlyD [Rhodospirillum rubrum ATCC 11170]AEO46568.1 secretion protein HlyD [Rhodospirillum rubrum F11]MBK5952459.1 secretion protein HlyD [Rhodospirillum rubrum]QXG80601.1 HlyD family efflux transporter periplasmic adaptor subunit [Rhodospirillum rubrum]HCF16903.1 secretion protein HlyD [Rhodospirillum rubrum]
MKLSSLLLALLLLIVVGGGGWLAWNRLMTPRLPEGIVVGSGRIEAREITLAAPLGGRIETVLIEEGAVVEAGQPLARIDSPTLAPALSEARMRAAGAQAAQAEIAAPLAEAEAAMAAAHQEMERALVLQSRRQMSRQSVEQRRQGEEAARVALAEITARAEAIDREKTLAEAEVSRLKALMEGAEIRAPIGGQVLYRLVEPGDRLEAGDPVFTLLDPAKVFMTFFLDAENAGRVPKGAEARIVLEDHPDRVLAATLAFIAPDARVPSGVGGSAAPMVRVKAHLVPDPMGLPLGNLRTGLSGHAFVRLTDTLPWPDRRALRP